MATMIEDAPQPTIQVDKEKLVFIMPGGDSFTISLREDILAKDDIHGALAWATFHRIHAMAVHVESQSQMMTAAMQRSLEMSGPDQVGATVKSILDQFKDILPNQGG